MSVPAASFSRVLNYISAISICQIDFLDVCAGQCATGHVVRAIIRGLSAVLTSPLKASEEVRNLSFAFRNESMERRGREVEWQEIFPLSIAGSDAR